MSQHSDITRQKISQGMVKHHAHRTDAQKAKTAERQSRAMKKYWQSIPGGKPIGSATRKPIPTIPTETATV